MSNFLMPAGNLILESIIHFLFNDVVVGSGGRF